VYDKAIRVAMQIAEKAFSTMDGDLSLAQIRDLITPFRHSTLIQRRRAQLIISRVHMVAAVFALLTPLWIVIDMLMFPWPLWGWLAGLRVVASGAFGVLALAYRPQETVQGAWRALIWLLSVPTVFFLLSHPLLNAHQIGGPASAVAAGYAFLPFVMVAGLSVFPITAIEGAVFAAPLLIAHFIAGIAGSAVFPFNSYLGALWLLVLLTVVATLAGMSQLHFMMMLVNQAAHDGLTGTFARPIGEELLRLQFHNAYRMAQPLSLVFVDIDNFKQINDRYGHEEGDRVLRDAAAALKRMTRSSDIVVRWGGEEFLLVLPNTDLAGALVAVERLRAAGLGLRPDNSPLTASIGIAETSVDVVEDWQALVEVADQRMYVAKQTGKNRVVSGAETVVV